MHFLFATKEGRVKKSMSTMSDATVVQHASRYLHLMSSLTPPAQLCFRSFVHDGVDGMRELSDAASRLALGGDDAIASLVIRPGHSSAFVVDGTHASATIVACPTPHTRLLVIVALLIAIILACVVMRRA